MVVTGPRSAGVFVTAPQTTTDCAVHCGTSTESSRTSQDEGEERKQRAYSPHRGPRIFRAAGSCFAVPGPARSPAFLSLPMPGTEPRDVFRGVKGNVLPGVER